MSRGLEQTYQPINVSTYQRINLSLYGVGEKIFHSVKFFVFLQSKKDVNDSKLCI